MPGRAPRQRAAYQREFYARPENAHKNRARHITKYAIESGKLVRQPCEACGEPKTEAHHDDYSKPLDIRWLCKKCHSAVHYFAVSENGKPHCIHGHDFSDPYTSPGRPWRTCRECRQISLDKGRLRKRLTATVTEQ